MPYFCFKCAKTLDLGANAFVARKDECPGCRSDLHVCRNCRHFDPNAYNQCRENQAERIVEKDRSNMCDYFKFADRASAGGPVETGSKDQLKKLDDLFK
ncbi:MAG: hypothetical protein K1X83_01595 [Oligoflexia bacterium]|nr:hypothetical protein [Oligoflexia bacterium]